MSRICRIGSSEKSRVGRRKRSIVEDDMESSMREWRSCKSVVASRTSQYAMVKVLVIRQESPYCTPVVGAQ
jgi:hypothetical protein